MADILRVNRYVHEDVTAASVPALSITIGLLEDRSTWIVTPSALQGAAQPIINAFDASDEAIAARDRLHQQRTIGSITAVRLGADRATSLATLQDVVGLSFDLQPNTHYGFKFTGAYSSVAAATGIQLSIMGPPNPTHIRFIGEIHESDTARRSAARAVYDQLIAGTGSGGATALPFWIQGSITTGAQGGALIVRGRSETAGQEVKILAGSLGELYGVS